MQKIGGKLHYDIIMAASDKRLFKDGIKIELSWRLEKLGTGKKNLTKKEMQMLCAVFNKSIKDSNSNSFNAREIMKFYKIQERSWSGWINVIIELYEKGIVSFPRPMNSNINRYNPKIFIDKILLDEILNGSVNKLEFPDRDLFFERIGSLNLMKTKNEISYHRLEAEFLNMYESLRSNDKLRDVTDYQYDEELVFNFLILSKYFNESDMVSMSSLYDTLDMANYTNIFSMLKKKELILQKKDMIRLATRDNRFDNNRECFIEIERNAIKKYLREENGADLKSNILHKKNLSAINKEMIYASKLDKEICSIIRALDINNYDQVTRKIKDSGYSNGMTFLFSGPSGTGKSRTVYEIAKECGREVLEADLAQLSGNGFVGDSERQAKRLFSEYNRFKKSSTNVPILLINEADSIFSTRINIRHSADIGHNSQINILLDELDKFKGILFATTNLLDNFDPALNRRFLSKISFPEPGENIRALIWKNKLPDLNMDQCKKLAGFNISGGLIENISKRYALNNIFEMSEPDYTGIRDMVIKETGSFNRGSKKISGFINYESA